MGRAERPEIIDAEYEVVRGPDYPQMSGPWWRGAFIVPIPNFAVIVAILAAFVICAFWAMFVAGGRAEQACSVLAAEHTSDAAWTPTPACARPQHTP